MDKLKARQNEMIDGVCVFLKSHPEFFPDRMAGRELADRILRSSGDLQDQYLRQLHGLRDAQVAREQRLEARQQLQQSMASISSTAGLIAKSVLGFADPFRKPVARNDAALMESARQVASAADRNLEEFVRYGLDTSFVDDLRTSMRSLEDAENRIISAQRRHSAASAEISATIKDAMNAIRALDVVLRNVLREKDPNWAVWQDARKVHRTLRRKKRSPDSTRHPLPEGALPR